jgi:hypothetical protein
MKIPILTERLYDFSNLGSGATSDVVIVKAIDVSAYRSGTLQVRVHDADYGSNSPTLKVVAYMTCPSIDDPSVDFVGDAKATVTLEGGVTTVAAGELGDAALAASFGSHLRIVVEATQADPADTLRATLSADLVLHEEPGEP